MHLQRIAILALVLLTLAGNAFATEPLRVCAGENDLPYSNKEGKGFENRLAEWIAADLGRPLRYVWWQDPRYFIRDQLDRGLCDVVMGVDTDDPRMLTTAPYYRSGYVFIHRTEEGVKVSDWDSPFLAQAKNIAFVPATPAETMLRKIGRYSDQFHYLQSLVDFKSRRNQYVRYDPERLVQEVATKHADLAVLWGPQAGRYVKAAGGILMMEIIPDRQTRTGGERVPHHYSTSVGVRRGETGLLGAIDRVLKKRQKDIETLLQDEGVPLLPMREGKMLAKAATELKP
jgi:mxaJ protein